MQHVTKAMVFAAGLGTRLKPWTDFHPKALALVQNKPLLQHNMAYLQRYGISQVVINVHHFAQQIIDALQQNNNWGLEVWISNESNELLDTGGGLLKALPLLLPNQHILAINADILTNFPLNLLIDKHISTGAMATLAVTNRTSSRYFLFDENEQLCGWKNVATQQLKLQRDVPEHQLQLKAFCGIQVINTNLFNHIHLTGKFSVVDMYLSICKQQKVVSFNYNDAVFIDVGKPETLQQAQHMQF